MIIGTPVAGRPHADLEQVIGMFVGTLALRNEVKKEATFLEQVAEVKRRTLEAFEHADYPLEELVEKLDLERDMSRNPLFDTMFAMQNMTEAEASYGGGLKMTPYGGGEEAAKFDLTLQASEMEGRLVFQLQYRTSLYRRASMERLAGHFVQLLTEATSKPEERIGELSLLPEEERERLAAFNGTEAPYPKEQTIHGLFEEQVKRAPERTALVYGEERLSYAELNARSNRLARRLREQGVGADELVGIALERSTEMIVAILAVLKAGGAYVPIDPSYPEERIRYTLEDAEAKLVLTQTDLAEKFAGITESLLVLERKLLEEGDGTDLPEAAGAEHLAYVIYTSGSTGRPKGVLIEHRHAVNLLHSLQQSYPCLEQDSYLLKTSVTFDVSVAELFGWFLGGGRLIVLESGAEKEPESLIRTMNKHQVTHVNFVPSMLYAMMSALEQSEIGLPDTKYIFSAGEALTAALIRQYFLLRKQSKVMAALENLYGPTEATVYASRYAISEEDGERLRIPIGKPLDNIRLYVVNSELNQQPFGILGELCIAGAGLGRGYLNRPELTEEKFVNHCNGERLYRTGDLVRQLSDGTIEYWGRIDHQIKVRGYRIELGEIEARLLSHSQVQEAIVVALKDSDGNNDLCAYVTIGGNIGSADLRSYLGKELPNYMVPVFIVQLQQMPLTPNGKVDRKRLPVPDRNVVAGESYVAPRTELEAKLAEIWQSVLGLDRIGARDNFFELGGHSLKATALVARLHKELHVHLSLRSVFEAPTLEEMTKRITGYESSMYASIEAVEQRSWYPVSPAQKRMYFLNQLGGSQQSYNMPGAYVVTGELDQQRVEEAIRKLIRRHEPLRTSFELLDGIPVQRLHDEAVFSLETGKLPDADGKTIADCHAAFIRPFDLSRAPLLRAAVMTLSPDRHLFQIDMHHIISDGLSLDVMVKEFEQLYAGESLPELRIQYKDYVVWQERMAQSNEMKQQEKYWLDMFQGELPVLDLQTDFPRPAVQSFKGDAVHFTVGSAVTDGLRLIAQETGATLYMVLLAAYTVLVSKYSGLEDIVVGTPVSGRPHVDMESLMGMFVHTLALRNFPKADLLFVDYVEEVKQRTIDAFDHAEYQLEELIEKLGVARDLSRNPLFETLFAFRSKPSLGQRSSEWTIEPYEMADSVAKFSLSLYILEQEEDIVCSLEYCTALYNRETIERMKEHFLNVLGTVAANFTVPLHDIKLISEDEQYRIVHEFNDTWTPYPEEMTVDLLFEAKAQKHPEKLAAVWGESRLTYGQLNIRANRLAHSLMRRGICAGTVVAIAAERSLEMLVGILAVLKTGAAYLPIDPDQPMDRIQYMLEDCGVKFVLCQPGFEGKMPDVMERLAISATDSYGESEGCLMPSCAAGNDRLAYVMYTSGSTGKPKGVKVSHKNIVRLVCGSNFVDWNECGKILQTGAIGFDATTFEIFGALLNGGTLYLAPLAELLEPVSLRQLIQCHQITAMWLTSSLFNFLSDSTERVFEGIRVLLVGGEPLSPKHVAKVMREYDSIQIINGYGPTENTTFSTCYTIPNQEFAAIPIGRPISNSKAYIFSSGMQLAPIGVAGEIYVGGDGVAEGYLNNPELTAERFVPDPYAPNGKLYRTGDLGRWLSDGNIQYLGRIDSDQVKINGYRMELAEIETALNRLEEIQESAVIACEREDGSKYLSAFLVLMPACCDAADIRKRLLDYCPGYMIPSYFTTVDKLPLTLNGKIDRAALQALEKPKAESGRYEVPRNEAETLLATIWQSTLGIERIGIYDNFFECGGDSIKAIQMAARLQPHQLELSIKDIFQNPTIAELAKYLRKKESIVSQEPVEGELLPTPIQKWFFERDFTERYHFNHSVMMRSDSGVDEARLEKALLALANHHDAIRIVVIEEGKRLYNRPADCDRPIAFEVKDLRGAGSDMDLIREEAERLQRSVDLSNGPLLKACLFKTETCDYVLIVLHHLVVDGVSWRIILEDLMFGYKNSDQQETIKLPLKTHSFMQWSRQLEQYAESRSLLQEKAYWDQIESVELEEIPQDYTVQNNLTADSGAISVFLSVEETEQLLRNAHRAYHTEINDLLLTALGQAVKEWSGLQRVLLAMEGHGREQVVESVDISRTVGWFTSMYPVLLDMSRSEQLPYMIKSTKEMLRNLPHKGVGYGILKYLTPDDRWNGKRYDRQPPISFNYLGQFDQDIANEEFIVMDDELSGQSVSPSMERSCIFDIGAMIVNGKLSFTIEYNRKMYEASTVTRFADMLKDQLLRIIDLCLNQKEAEKTPSDLGYGKLALEEFEHLKKKLSIKLAGKKK
ncbi:amino acid adenylation domain-containing protein [Paenibacillus oenotherae]|uniref:amino acid adenylation domain-containing protein n=1 Tax=Paenibacillus oenotherae TaxID=1435645 RepID=UPI0031BB2B94